MAAATSCLPILDKIEAAKAKAEIEAAKAKEAKIAAERRREADRAWLASVTPEAIALAESEQQEAERHALQTTIDIVHEVLKAVDVEDLQQQFGLRDGPHVDEAGTAWLYFEMVRVAVVVMDDGHIRLEWFDDLTGDPIKIEHGEPLNLHEVKAVFRDQLIDNENLLAEEARRMDEGSEPLLAEEARRMDAVKINRNSPGISF